MPALLVLQGPSSAGAAVIVVNDPGGDVHSPGCADTGTGTCTLADAITFANSNPGLDEIHFDIPGEGIHEIEGDESGRQPDVTSPVVIDGFTQPGSRANTNGPRLGDNAVRLIRVAALSLTGGSSTVRGLETSLTLEGQSECCFSDGIQDVVEGILGDVSIREMSGEQRIGGPAPGARNVLSNVEIVDSFVTILGSFIGTDATGTKPFVDAGGTAVGRGIHIDGADGLADVGGPDPRDENVISGNLGAGVTGGDQSASFTIVGNLIGTDVTGTSPLPNGAWGIDLGDTSARIEANVISGNRGGGISIGTEADALVLRNLIGTDVTGAGPLGNRLSGIETVVRGDFEDNVIAFNGSGDPVGEASSSRKTRVFRSRAAGTRSSETSATGRSPTGASESTSERTDRHPTTTATRLFRPIPPL